MHGMSAESSISDPFALMYAAVSPRQCRQQQACFAFACMCGQIVMLLRKGTAFPRLISDANGYPQIDSEAGAVCLQSMHKVFFEAYDWRSFLLALGCSLVGMALMAVLENLVLRPLLKGVCPSYFEPRQAPATLPHQKFSGESDRSPTGTSAYPGGAQPSAPKMAI